MCEIESLRNMYLCQKSDSMSLIIHEYIIALILINMNVIYATASGFIYLLYSLTYYKLFDDFLLKINQGNISNIANPSVIFLHI